MKYKIFLITFLSLVTSFYCSAQEIDQPGYRFLKRIRGIKILDSKIQEVMIDEGNNRLAISYRSKKLLYVSVYQLYSWDKINDYKLDSRVELYNSYFADGGKSLFANIDVFKLLYLKIDLLNGQFDSLECNATPRGCNKVDQAVYKTRLNCSDNNYLVIKDDEHENDLLVYYEMNKYNLLKTQLEKDLNKSVTIIDIRDKLENDARKKYGTFKPITQQVAASEISTSKPSIILTKENILDLLEDGTFENNGVVVKLDEQAKIAVKEMRAKAERADSQPKQSSTASKSSTKTISDGQFEVGEVIKLNNILFEQGKSSLLPESYTELDKLVNILKTNASMEIQVNGHTNNIGVQNLEVSEKRAKAVVDYLQSKGVMLNRLKYKGFGDTQPVASNDTEEGRKLNRRVEIAIIKK